MPEQQPPPSDPGARQSWLRLDVKPGRALRDALVAHGVEFPCGGEGTCGQCRVRVRDGSIPATTAMKEALSPEQLREGWRLGCLALSEGPVLVEVEQWLGSRVPLPWESVPLVGLPRAPHPALVVEQEEGYAIAVDVGTTTLVAQLLDLRSGAVLNTATAWNPQVRWGADLMSRVRHDLARPGELQSAIRMAVGDLVAKAGAGKSLCSVLLVGNTVMQHLFCGLPVDALAAVPFRSPHTDAIGLDASALGWAPLIEGPVYFVPPLGGFVGSDLLAGLLAARVDLAETPTALLDLGTNGEIALAAGTANGGEILCASTAAGPAFEAANISCGMRAEPGAIHKVAWEQGGLRCEVLGDTAARGICGSGLVDAISSALDVGLLQPNGRLGRAGAGASRASGLTLALADGIQLTQRDIRELQLAKAAIASGLALLEAAAGVRAERLFLAGAFGNYLRVPSAQRIGLLPGNDALVESVGNSALHGARLLLLAPTVREATVDALRARCRHVELAALAGFQDAFVDALALEPWATAKTAS